MMIQFHLAEAEINQMQRKCDLVGMNRHHESDLSHHFAIPNRDITSVTLAQFPTPATRATVPVVLVGRYIILLLQLSHESRCLPRLFGFPPHPPGFIQPSTVEELQCLPGLVVRLSVPES